MQPTLLQDVQVLGNQLEKLLASTEDSLTEYSDLEASINGDQIDGASSKEVNTFTNRNASELTF